MARWSKGPLLAGGLATLAFIGVARYQYDASVVKTFCQEHPAGSSAVQLATTAKRAGLHVWTLPSTIYEGRWKRPIVVAERGYFVCALEIEHDEVRHSRSQLERAFAKRWPRRIKAFERASKPPPR